jgi:DNA-binding transcriptional LysR family regulator
MAAGIEPAFSGWLAAGRGIVEPMATHRMAAGDLDPGLLRTFLTLVSSGSLGKTAASIDKTQSAVSQQMLRLEKILGQKLFTRGRDGITLTHHGELLETYSKRAVELHDEMLARFRAESAGGQVVLGISNSVALTGFAAAMQRLTAFHPDMELRVVMAVPAKLDAMLTGGDPHLAISEPSFMRRTPVATWGVPLQWAAQKDSTIDQSQAVPLVLFEGSCSWQDDMLNSLRRGGREWRITFESSSLDAILAATKSGLGIAALPAEVIRRSRLVHLKSARLPPAPTIEFGLFQATALPKRAQTLLEVIRTSTFKPTQSTQTNREVGISVPSSGLAPVQFVSEGF